MSSLTSLQRVLSRVTDQDLFLVLVTRNQNGVQFSNLTRFKFLLDVLSHSDFFNNEVEFLKRSALYQSTTNELFVKHGDNPEEIWDAANFIENAVVALNHVMPRLLPEEPAESVYVRFPDAESVQVITADLQAIEKAAMQIIAYPEVAGSFKITHWESGSLWIHVAVGSITAVTILAGAAWSAAVVAKKWMEFRIFFEHAKGLSIKNDSLSDLEEAQKKLLDQLVSQEAQALADKHFDTKSHPETVERVRYTITIFSELIRRGGEVAPALNAPETVENLFPKYRDLLTTQSQIKQIEDTEG